ncbi:RNA polymerase Rpb4 family protein [Staphylothermus hellenicus]|uniref:DNA-directed RNA polymerase subunit Rpo4 n=1 Tax=Staphylothermus hellenicus (strain DSM 12710 / JCM 10830 / BK20S6-10-b1 / P8) TaxID=591019 RepID=D7DAH6_STAHD|nr:RNA polymerase Rpb4 family protein [Staphylothermus hellenicus]ADI31173.1 RNA polymerase Rpb4 [Staphylothermus hellenicus DSM 12710]
MAEELDVEVLEEKLLSNPEAYKLLKKAVDKIQEREGSVSMLLSKTLHYLSEFSKMEPESSEALRNVLKNMDLKDETIVMIINICPQTLDELRILFELEEKVIDTETAQQILEAIKPYCKE